MRITIDTMEIALIAFISEAKNQGVNISTIAEHAEKGINSQIYYKSNDGIYATTSIEILKNTIAQVNTK